MSALSKFFSVFLVFLGLFLTGCGGSSGTGFVGQQNSSEGGASIQSSSAVLLFDLGSPVIRARVATQASTFVVTAYGAGGQQIRTAQTGRVEQLRWEGLPSGPILFRTLFLDSSGQTIGYLDRFTTLVAGQTSVLELTGFITGSPPQGAPTFPGGAGTPAQLVFVESPASVVSGASFPVAVLVLDAHGAPLPNVTGSVNLTARDASLSGQTSTNLNDGVGRFEGVAATVNAPFRLTATVQLGGVTLQAESLQVAVSTQPTSPNVGVPASLRVVSGPTGGTAGQPLTPLVVEVLDVYGARVSGSGLTVTVSLSQNPLPPDGATLSGALSGVTNQGLVTFSGLSLDWAGVYRFNVFAPGVIGGASASFTLSPAPPEPSLPGSGLFDGLLLAVRNLDTQFGENNSPRDVLSEDFNSDGIPDLVTVSPAHGTKIITFYPGVGDGTFAAPKETVTTLRMQTAVAGDVNSDGALDLVATSFESGGVARVFLNDGTGQFVQQLPLLNAGSGCYEASLADFNNDGNLDVITVNRDANTLSLFLGHGDGTFGVGTSLSLVGAPVGVVAVDFDQDGWTDLATTQVDSGTVTLMRNMSGSFVVEQTLTMGNGAFGLALSDLDVDGRSDLITTNRDADQIAIRRGLGGFVFGPVETLPTGHLPYDVTVLDVDGDGRKDLVTANFGGGTNTLWKNLAGGWSSETVPAGPGAISVASADFDGDGLEDLAIGLFSQTSVLIRLNDGAGSFRVPPIIASGASGSVLAGDLNGDGIPDIVSNDTAWPDPLSLAVRLGVGDGTFQAPITHPYGQVTKDSQLIDLDDDGDLDVFIGNFSSFQVLKNNGGGVLAPPQTTSLNWGEYYALGDVNDDGLPDVLASNDYSNQILVFLNQGGNFGSTPDNTISVINAQGLALGDFDGDGSLDLVYRGQTSSFVALGNGDGTFGTSNALTTTTSLSDFRVGDINGDGVPDIVGLWIGGLEVLVNQGAGTFSAPLSLGSRLRLTDLHLVDLNGDEVLDVVTTSYERFDSLVETVQEVQVYLNRGDGTFKIPQSYQLGFGRYAEIGRVGLGDFDGDGDTDIAVADEVGGVLRLLLNR